MALRRLESSDILEALADQISGWLVAAGLAGSIALDEVSCDE